MRAARGKPAVDVHVALTAPAVEAALPRPSVVAAAAAAVVIREGGETPSVGGRGRGHTDRRTHLYLFVCSLSVCLSVCLSLSLSLSHLYLFVCSLSLSLSVCLSVSLPPSLSPSLPQASAEEEEEETHLICRRTHLYLFVCSLPLLPPSLPKLKKKMFIFLPSWCYTSTETVYGLLGTGEEWHKE